MEHAAHDPSSFGAPMNAPNDVDIFKASKFGWLDRVQQLIEGPNGRELLRQYSSPQGGAPLHWACWSGRTDVVNYLINAGAAVNHPVLATGLQPIHWASIKPNMAVADLLLQHGADLNALDISKNTPLIRAVQSQQHEMVVYLIGKGADIFATDKDGDDALHWAANRGDLRTARLLISMGLDPKRLDMYGQNSLHLAVVSGSLELVQELVHQGVSVTIEDINGKTPLKIAENRGKTHQHIQEYLRHVGSSALSWRRLLWNRRGDSVASSTVALLVFAYVALIYYRRLFNQAEGEYTQHLAFLLLQVVVWLGVFRSLCMSTPGNQQSNPADLGASLKRYSEMKNWQSEDASMFLRQLCYTCRLVRQERVWHCPFCRKCVQEMDRHFNTGQVCIGQRNRKLFFFFLLLLLLSCVVLLRWCWAVYRREDETIDWTVTSALLLVAGTAYSVLVNLANILVNTSRGLTKCEASCPDECSYLHKDSHSGRVTTPYNYGLFGNFAWFFNMRPKHAAASHTV
eukprot:m.98732 g.98732  ORF g.98732 m.98732 type:complete len:514 (+) comp18578_c0_seq3:220-1761(+)